MIIVPFNRPKQLPHVLQNWKNQTVKTPLVLVANSVGEWSKDAIRAGATVLIGQASIGGARNKGLEFAKEAKAEWAHFWDDDNHYGAQYIQQVQEYISPDVDILSQGIGFVRLKDGLLYKFKSPLSFAPGHCTSVRVSKAVEFPEWSLSEDAEWSRRMREKGAVLARLPAWHSVYNRMGNGHAYGAGDTEFKASFREHQLIGKVGDSFVDNPKDLSKFNYEFVQEQAIYKMLNQHLTFRH